MTGLWPELARRFENKTGCHVEVVAAGERPLLAEALRAGKVDLLTMHSGDITTDLVADGYGVNMRPWTRNQLVIVGPPDDPAGIRGMHEGAEALRKIAGAHANFIDAQNIGPREVVHALWHRIGLRPAGDWILKDEATGHLDLLKFAERHHAYLVVGRMPVVLGKIPSGKMEILVDNDPAMRRPYIVMEANPARFPQANYRGATALADFLLSAETQKFLLTFGKEECGGINPFFPVAPAAWPWPGSSRTVTSAEHPLDSTFRKQSSETSPGCRFQGQQPNSTPEVKP